MSTYKPGLAIGIDADGTFMNLHAKLVQRWNERWWNVSNPVNVQPYSDEAFALGNELDDFLASDGLFDEVEPLPGALEGISEIAAHVGWDALRIVSAPSRNPDSATAKLRAFRKYLPKIARQRICLYHEKERVDVDIIIEDWPSQVKNIKAHAPSRKILGVEHPYNTAFREYYDLLAPSCFDTVRAWEQIVAWVKTNCRAK